MHPVLLFLAATPLTTAPQTDRPSSALEIAVPGKPARARVWTAKDSEGRLRSYASLSLDGVTFTAPRETRNELELRYGRFDPTEEGPVVPEKLRAQPSNRLFVVQYHTQGLEDYRDVLRELGAEVHLFLAHNANVVELEPSRLATVRALPFVRAVRPFHPAYKLEEELLQSVMAASTGPVRVNLLVMARGDDARVAAWIEAQGGSVFERSSQARFLSAELGHELLAELASLDEVQWIERWGPRVMNLDLAREFHGANHVEALHGLTGTGVRVEVMDLGFDLTHPDLQNHMRHGSISPGAHGTCTAGILTGDGIGDPNARGMAPNSFLVVAETDIFGSRYEHTAELVDPSGPYQCVLQSNSWSSSPETDAYNSIAAQLDTILFDFPKISILHAMGNTGNQVCSRETWSKNVISVGGIFHRNTLITADDDWDQGASIGPARDGRVKPDIVSFYDMVRCTDVVGNGGYSSGDYYSAFSGTSAATPLVAGSLALIYEMWHLGLFGNPHAGATPFENAPFNTTAKALLLNSATQYAFSGTVHDMTRTHQGWGRPDLEKLANSLGRMVVVDEATVLTNLSSRYYGLEVLPGETELHATLVYRDPSGTTTAGLHRINDLDLTLTSPSNVVYHGNFGLDIGTTSLSGGNADPLNTVEHVILPAPESGLWVLTVTATELNEDNHVETPELDADYALVVRGAVESLLPLAPSHLSGRGSSRSAVMRWRDISSNETGFELERSLDGVNFLPHATLPADTTTYVDVGLTPNTDYHYRVRSVNGNGVSPWSGVLHVRTIKADRR
jgi:hypothetical protein